MSSTLAEASFADDLLRGAEKIAVFIYGDPGLRREIYRNPGRLPFFTIGSTICARKSTLIAEIAEREKAARERVAAPKLPDVPHPKRPRGRRPRGESAARNTPAAQ